LSVLDVLNAVDPPRRIRECPLGLAAHAHALCPLHQRLDDAMALIEKSFRSTTIADVTSEGTLKPLGNGKAALTISGGLSIERGRRQAKADRRVRRQ
jgi:DNA-binding IscR family transcriptional regulator